MKKLKTLLLLGGLLIPMGVNATSGHDIIQENKSIQVGVGEEFHIAMVEGETIDNTFNLSYSKDYFDVDTQTGILSFGFYNEDCSTGSVTDTTNNCGNPHGSWSNLAFSEEGTYTLIALRRDLSDPTSEIVYEYTYTITVGDGGTEVGPSEIMIDNTATIETLKDEIYKSEITITEESKVESIKVTKDEFSKAAQNNVGLVYEVIKDNKLSYSWTFKKVREAFAKEIDLMLNTNEISTKLQETFNKNDSYSLNFAFHGVLPGDADVKVYVGDKYKAGDTLFLYYNNIDNNKIEFISKGLVVDSDGYVKVSISHCSEYVLTKSEVKLTSDTNTDNTTTDSDTKKEEAVLDDEPKTNDITSVIYSIGAISIIGTTIYLSRKQRA